MNEETGPSFGTVVKHKERTDSIIEWPDARCDLPCHQPSQQSGAVNGDSAKILSFEQNRRETPGNPWRTDGDLERAHRKFASGEVLSRLNRWAVPIHRASFAVFGFERPGYRNRNCQRRMEMTEELLFLVSLPLVHFTTVVLEAEACCGLNPAERRKARSSFRVCGARALRSNRRRPGVLLR